MMERHFTDEQIDEFLAAYLKRYPDALGRIFHVMRNPLDDNDEMIARCTFEMIEISKTLDFFREYERDNERAFHLICIEFLQRISSVIE